MLGKKLKFKKRLSLFTPYLSLKMFAKHTIWNTSFLLSTLKNKKNKGGGGLNALFP